MLRIPGPGVRDSEPRAWVRAFPEQDAHHDRVRVVLGAARSGVRALYASHFPHCCGFVPRSVRPTWTRCNECNPARVPAVLRTENRRGRDVCASHGGDRVVVLGSMQLSSRFTMGTLGQKINLKETRANVSYLFWNGLEPL